MGDVLPFRRAETMKGDKVGAVLAIAAGVVLGGLVARMFNVDRLLA